MAIGLCQGDTIDSRGKMCTAEVIPLAKDKEMTGFYAWSKWLLSLWEGWQERRRVAEAERAIALNMAALKAKRLRQQKAGFVGLTDLQWACLENHLRLHRGGVHQVDILAQAEAVRVTRLKQETEIDPNRSSATINFSGFSHPTSFGLKAAYKRLVELDLVAFVDENELFARLVDPETTALVLSDNYDHRRESLKQIKEKYNRK